MFQLGAISLSSMGPLLVQIIIVAMIFWLVWWFIRYIGVPEPFNKVLRVLTGLFALIYLINVLVTIGGGQPFIVW